MIPGIEALACEGLAVPADVMHHIVRVESSYNPFAIGVVGTRLARQPRTLAEAVATARQLERDGFNFSLGLAQVNLHNLARQGLHNYTLAFDPCPNLVAGSRILADCHGRADGDWDKAFSCYYSGNFSTGFRHGYVRKVRASMAADGDSSAATAMATAGVPPKWAPGRASAETGNPGPDLVARRTAPAESADAAASSGAAAPAARRPATADPGAFVPTVTMATPDGAPVDAKSRTSDRSRDGAFVF